MIKRNIPVEIWPNRQFLKLHICYPLAPATRNKRTFVHF